MPLGGRRDARTVVLGARLSQPTMNWSPSSGVDQGVADWLGHSSPTITLATYAHLMPADEEVARTVLDAVLGTSRGQTADKAGSEGDPRSP